MWGFFYYICFMALTSTQMHAEFKREIDEFATGRIEDSELDGFLNDAVEDFVDSRYHAIKQQFPYSFESNRRITNDLRTLVEWELAPGTKGMAYSDPNLTLPTDFRYDLRLKITVNGTSVEALPVDIDWLGANEDNPHVSPSATRVKYAMNDNGILIRTGGVVASSPILTYLKNPAIIQLGAVNCDLPGHTHLEIVKKAAAAYLDQMEKHNNAQALKQQELES